MEPEAVFSYNMQIEKTASGKFFVNKFRHVIPPDNFSNQRLTTNYQEVSHGELMERKFLKIRLNPLNPMFLLIIFYQE